jgi:hypothetical protein
MCDRSITTSPSKSVLIVSLSPAMLTALPLITLPSFSLTDAAGAGVAGSSAWRRRFSGLDIKQKKAKAMRCPPVTIRRDRGKEEVHSQWLRRALTSMSTLLF